MQLLVINSTQQKSHEIEWLEINTLQGNFVIQSEHAPTIFVLAPDSTVSYLAHGSQIATSLLIKQGVVEITRARATLIITQTS